MAHLDDRRATVPPLPVLEDRVSHVLQNLQDIFDQGYNGEDKSSVQAFINALKVTRSALTADSRVLENAYLKAGSINAYYEARQLRNVKTTEISDEILIMNALLAHKFPQEDPSAPPSLNPVASTPSSPHSPVASAPSSLSLLASAPSPHS